MTHYVGILEGAGKVWSIRIPDVPGCHGGGITPEEALADTISALREMARLYAADGIVLGPARDMQAIRKDASAEFDPATESLVLVPAILETGKLVKADLSIDAGTLAAIDAAAERRGLTRSSFLASAALSAIEREPA